MGQSEVIKMAVSATSGELAAGVRNPAAVYLSGLATAGGVATQRRALDVIAAIATGGRSSAAEFPWHLLEAGHVNLIRAELIARYAPATGNRMMSALRGTLRECWRLRLMSHEEYERAIDVKPIEGSRELSGRALAGGELAALLGTCDSTDTGIRDAAVIAVLYGCGLRRAELVGLDLASYDRTAQELKIIGKGNKERTIPADAAERHLADWLAIRGDEAGPLFWGTGNRQRGGRLTTQAVYNLIQRRAARAGVPALSPHDMRRSFVSGLLDAGADLATVQKLAGHADANTTSRYDRRGDAAKRKAVKLLHVPYQRAA